MEEEIKKVLPAIQIAKEGQIPLNEELRLTLVIIPLCPKEPTFRGLEYQKDSEWLLQTRINELQLPKNFDVIYLLPKGVNDFVTKSNFKTDN